MPRGRQPPEGLGPEDSPMGKRPVTALRGAQWLIIVGLVIGSFVAEGAGHSALSWSLDGVAVAAYLLIRSLIRWQEADPRRMRQDSVSPIPDCDSGSSRNFASLTANSPTSCATCPAATANPPRNY